MEEWIRPAIIAAIVSGLVTVIGWYVNNQQTKQRETQLRVEKINDYLIALRAEIRSELKNLEAYDLSEILEETKAKYKSSETYSVTVPKLPTHVIFNVLSREIHILPEPVIDPVVIYARQRESVEMLIEDMRTPEFRDLPDKTQISIYEDHLNMRRAWTIMAKDALDAIENELS